MRSWTAAEILRGLDDAFAADERPAVLFSVNRTPITRLSPRSAASAGFIETRSPRGFDSCAPAHLKLVRFPSSLAATHRGFAFYVAFAKSSIRPLGLTHLCRSHPCGSVRRGELLNSYFSF